jgi:FHA domain-containing protein/type VI secretion system protein
MSIPADYDLLADVQAPAPVAAAAVAAAWPAAPLAASPAGAQAAPPQPSPPPAQAAPPQQAPAQPSPPPVPVPSSAGGDAVLQALLDGLGLPHLGSSHTPEQLARLVGEMLRAATAGTMDALRARTLTKRESHIDMTMIAPRANNPLKFFPDADSALTQMLGAQIPGYLPPLPAIGGAFDDLKAHELAVIAGMRAALAAVVQRFDPARIEQRLADPGRLDKLLPAGRKARMWDRLVELYGELARDADEDLQRLFGEKFSGAYAQQVERLRGERPSTNI